MGGEKKLPQEEGGGLSSPQGSRGNLPTVSISHAAPPAWAAFQRDVVSQVIGSLGAPATPVSPSLGLAVLVLAKSNPKAPAVGAPGPHPGNRDSSATQAAAARQSWKSTAFCVPGVKDIWRLLKV